MCLTYNLWGNTPLRFSSHQKTILLDWLITERTRVTSSRAKVRATVMLYQKNNTSRSIRIGAAAMLFLVFLIGCQYAVTYTAVNGFCPWIWRWLPWLLVHLTLPEEGLFTFRDQYHYYIRRSVLLTLDLRPSFPPESHSYKTRTLPCQAGKNGSCPFTRALTVFLINGWIMAVTEPRIQLPFIQGTHTHDKSHTLIALRGAPPKWNNINRLF